MLRSSPSKSNGAPNRERRGRWSGRREQGPETGRVLKIRPLRRWRRSKLRSEQRPETRRLLKNSRTPLRGKRRRRWRWPSTDKGGINFVFVRSYFSDLPGPPDHVDRPTSSSEYDSCLRGRLIFHLDLKRSNHIKSNKNGNTQNNVNKYTHKQHIPISFFRWSGGGGRWARMGSLQVGQASDPVLLTGELEVQYAWALMVKRLNRKGLYVLCGGPG